MKTLYLQCNMGAAGDMLAGALLELHPEPASFLARFNSLGLPGIHMSAEPSVKCGIHGTHIHVHVHGQEEHEHSHTHGPGTHHHHAHASYQQIGELIETLPVPERVKKNALGVYRSIGEAESKVHGVSLEQIHFHEVGTLDAVADVVACCLLLDELAPEKIIASPVHVGSGTVVCAHGEPVSYTHLTLPTIA